MQTCDANSFIYFSLCARTWDGHNCWCWSCSPPPSTHHHDSVAVARLLRHPSNTVSLFLTPPRFLTQVSLWIAPLSPSPPPSSCAFVSLPFHLSPTLLLLRPPPSPYLLRSPSLPRRAGRVICKCADSCSPSPGFDSAVDVINSSANCDSSQSRWELSANWHAPFPSTVAFALSEKERKKKKNGVRIGRYSLPRSPLRHIVSYFLFLFFSLKCVFGLPPLLLPHPSLSNHPTAITPLLSSVSLGLLTSLMGISINTGALGPSGPWRLNVWHLEPRRQILMWSSAASPFSSWKKRI